MSDLVSVFAAIAERLKIRGFYLQDRQRVDGRDVYWVRTEDGEWHEVPADLTESLRAVGL
jgi:hypothetical protein